MKFREKVLTSGNKLILGKDEESNEELMNGFLNKDNIVLHTHFPGSPFGIIEKIRPSQTDIKEAAVIVAKHSQDWRDNRDDVKVNIFIAKDVYKLGTMRTGTFGVKRSKSIVVHKKDILKLK